MNMTRTRALGAMLGVAVGDALGATLEFMNQTEIKQQYGLHQEVIGGGHWNLEPGEVTDDTDMTLAVARGILRDPENPILSIANAFLLWYETGPKDIGNICRLVLAEGQSRKPETPEAWYETAYAAHLISGGRSAGNGSLMRTVPVVIAYRSERGKMLQWAKQQSLITHYDPIAADCTAYYCEIVRDLIQGEDLKYCLEKYGEKAPVPLNIRLNDYDIKNTGYVVHTLEAAMNCAYQTNTFEEALVMAVNLGGDADTIGAVTGGIAGAYYGCDEIPRRWLSKVTVREEMETLTDRLLNICI